MEMKNRLFTLTVTIALLFSGVSASSAEALANDKPVSGKARHQRWANALDRMTKNLDLTPEQQAKIRPILDQARPQMEAASRESRQKMRAVRDNVRAQIR